MAAQLEQDMAVADAEQKRSSLEPQKKLFLHELTRLRVSQKLSQQQLATKAGMKQSEIARIEAGKGNPSLQTLLRITAALGTNIALQSVRL